MVQIGVDLGLFEKVVEAGPEGISLNELSAASNADPKLLGGSTLSEPHTKVPKWLMRHSDVNEQS